MEHYVVLTIGKSHSGKTTFARMLADSNPSLVVLETDPMRLFLKEYAPVLLAVDVERRHFKGQSGTSLVFAMFRSVFEWALEAKQNVILSNSNMSQGARDGVLSIVKQYPHRTIAVYLNYPEEVLLQRAKVSNRNTNVMSVRKTFAELIIKQRERFEVPNPADFDYFFEVRTVEDLNSVTKRVLEVLSLTR